MSSSSKLSKMAHTSVGFLFDRYEGEPDTIAETTEIGGNGSYMRQMEED